MAEENNNTFPLGKQNYILLAVGFGLVLLGFALMSGGKTPDPAVFNYDEIFSTRRISVAPVTILIGLGVVLYGIIKKPKED
jgi:hypothetical protein